MTSQLPSRDPFYTHTETFFDNPKWRRPVNDNLEWHGFVFPLFVNPSGEFFVGVGFSWGFQWVPSETSPQAFPIEKAELREFFKLSALFVEEFTFPPLVQENGVLR